MADYADPTVIKVSAYNNKLQPGAVLVLLAGIISLLFCGYIWWQNNQTNQKISTVEATLATDQKIHDSYSSVPKDLDTYTAAASNLHTLFDKQVRYENVLGVIEGRLYKNMKITSLQLGSDNSLSFSGSTPDYVNYGKLYTSLTDKAAQAYFLNVKPVSVSKVEKKDNGTTTSEIQFSFQMTLTSAVTQVP